MGANRKKITVNDSELLASLECLIEPETRGDPESTLRWICKSTRTLAMELTRQKHPVSHEKVAQLLRDQNCRIHPFNAPAQLLPLYMDAALPEVFSRGCGLNKASEPCPAYNKDGAVSGAVLGDGFFLYMRFLFAYFKIGRRTMFRYSIPA